MNPNHAVEIQHAWHHYTRPGSNTEYSSLADVNLDVRDGEFFSLVGPSGCGKSTLLNIIAGFEHPTSGSVVAFGEEVTKPGPERGVVFQSDIALFPWMSVEDNVSYGPRMRRQPDSVVQEKTTAYLQLVGLLDHRKKYPRELSGGMRQRCQIARVLANDAKLMLMDEPFAAVDAQSRRRLQREFASIWEQTRKSVVFVTHDVAEAVLLSDRVGIMGSGPGSQIQHVVTIDLPRPRDVRSPHFLDLVEDLTAELDDVLA